MPPRAIFKAVLHVGYLQAPVKLYSAIREERVHFRLLHKKDKEPLSRRMYCSKENKPVERDEQVRGFQVAKGQYVVLEPDEMDEAQIETEREIEVRHFIKEEEIDPRMYNRPYYLGPESGKNRYAMIARALNETGRIGLCTWNMRRRSYYGALKAVDDTLLLVTMRYEHEIIPVDRLKLKKRKVKKKELQSAKSLIKEMHDDFDPSEYRNDYQQELMHFIEQKARGKKPKKKRAKRRKATKPSELQKMLEKSLQEARQ
jgi:DNA end-binding protein Ku